MPLTYPYYATWWEIALQTPIFNQELKELLNNLKERALQDYTKALSGKLLQLENKLLLPLKNKISPLENELSQLQARMQKVEESQKIYGAKKRVQNHLNYKLGVVIVESQNIFKKVILPFRMARIVYLHKKQLKILQSLYALNPQLKPPALSRYSDLQEALSYQNSVFYQTGERFLNSCKQWSKGKFIKIL